MMKCKRLRVPKDVCYVSFNREKFPMKAYDSADNIGYTCRGEMVVADYDKDGAILGIELIGSLKARKPCQESGGRIGKKMSVRVTRSWKVTA